MDVLEISGIRYVKASVAAKRQGYTADYVGQLCRSGKVDAQRIGRAWYVREDALDTHKDTNIRSNKQKTIEGVQDLFKREYERGRIHNSLYTPPEGPAYRKRILEAPISYKEDSHPLFPQPQRQYREMASGEPTLTVEVELEDKASHKIAIEREDATVAEIEEEVHQVAVLEEDEPTRPWSATIDLTDTSKDVIFRAVEVPPEEPLSQGEIKVQFLDSEEDEEVVAVADMPDVTPSPHILETPRVSAARDIGIAIPQARAVAQRPVMSLVTISTIALGIMLVIGSIFLQNVWVYQSGVGTVAERPYFETSYGITAVSTIVEAISR